MKKSAVSLLLVLAVLFSCLFAFRASAAGVSDLNRPPKLVVSEIGSHKSAEVGHGSATWTWMEQEQAMTIVIDAVPPLSSFYSGREKTLEVPSSSLWSGALYRLQWDIAPDTVSMAAYRSSDLGNFSAQPLQTDQWTGNSVRMLKPNRIYDLWCTWGEAHLASGGGCGSVEYVILT